MNTQEQKPVAWMWQYIGKDPMANQIKPCARMIHEMDPNNPPYPESWRPIGPLYTQPAPAVEQAGTDAQRYQWLRSADPYSSPFICRNFGGMFTQWTGDQADAAIDAAMNQPKKGDKP